MSPRFLGSVVAIVAAGSLVGALGWTPTPPPAPPPAPAPPPDPPAAPPTASAEVAPAVPRAVEEADAPPPKPARCPPEPPIEVRTFEVPASAEELLRMAQERPELLGSASIGSSTRGSLFGGVELAESEGIVHAGGYAWGTERVVRSIERAVREVRRCFPDTPVLHVGDLSRDRGGWLRPHRSHQAGLDADIGYFYRGRSSWYERVTAQSFDAARTWSLVRALIEGGNVEMIFMDLSVQRLLKSYLETLPEDEQAPPDLFASPVKRDAIIRHAWGHATHFHVRFVDPDATALGARMAPLLPRLRKSKRR